jgi:siroheme synthase
MGITRVAEICRELVAHGLDPSTPAAAIERATAPEQRVVTASVGTLATATAAARVKPPALIVVGEVVSLRDRLDSQVASIAGLERAAAAS